MKQHQIKRLGLALLTAAIVLPFQNCSPTKKFGSTASTSSQMSGGEGYHGKLFDLVSASEPCADPALPPSRIKLLNDQTGELRVKNCQTLISAQLIPVKLRLPSILTFNGQTYREQTSTELFEPPFTVVQTIEAEDMSDLPSSGGGVNNGVLTITDNDQAVHAVNFPQTADWRIRVRARGRIMAGIGARLELRVDGVAVGAIFADSIFADYVFNVPVTAGAHSVGLAFTNDGSNTATGEDRNLYLDYFRIER